MQALITRRGRDQFALAQIRQQSSRRMRPPGTQFIDLDQDQLRPSRLSFHPGTGAEAVHHPV
jgi:hypothetical protein